MNESTKLDDNKLKSTLTEIKNDLDSLEEFIESNDAKCERFKRHLKCICDYLKIEDFDSTLPELIIDRECVDLEQIYQQMQLFNASDSVSISALTKFFSKSLLSLNSLTFGIDTTGTSSANGTAAASSVSKSSSATVSNNEETDADVEESESEESAAEEYSEDGEENGDELENGEEEEEEEDDEEEELKGEFDDEEDEEDEEGGGLFGNGDMDEEAFKAEMNNFDDEEDDEEDEDEDEFGLNGKGGGREEDDEDEEDEAERIEAEMATPSQKLKEKIDEIHDSMLKDFENKPWQLKGEVSAKSRPQDSLMEEYVEFDHTTRQAPIIDSTFTERLEKLIKQRIKDKAFDDVERKVRPVEMHYEYKKQVVLDSEKSKLGLGQIYEQEFLRQQQKQIDQAAQQSNETSNKEALANPKHEEIRKRLQTLFIKLDALSNFHFTPKAPTPEMKVVSNMPTINMEEVAPVNVADSNILAPEEIKGRINALPKSKTEEDKQDKSRKLRSKKLFARKRKHEREKKLEIAHAVDPNNPVISKEVAMNKLKKQAKNMSKNIKILKNDKKDKKNKTYSSSSAFFKQLQENNEVKKNGVAKKKKLDSNEQNKKSSKKLKL